MTTLQRAEAAEHALSQELDWVVRGKSVTTRGSGIPASR